MDNITANKLRKDIMKDCFKNKIGEEDIRVSLSKRHTGNFTIIVKEELLQNECFSDKIKGLSTHDSEDKKFLIVDEP
jgi:hypothetical protein